jgi:two-component system C4-dicarboxylate transport response regulator DctD
MTTPTQSLPQEPTIWLIDDDDDLRHALEQGLLIEGFQVEALPEVGDLLQQISSNSFGVIVSDIRMPGMDGMSLLHRINELDSALPTVLMTGHGDVPMAIQAIRAGAYDFMEKPFPVSRLIDIIKRALEKRRLVLENRSLRESLEDNDVLSQRLVGRSQGIDYLRQQISMLSETNVDALIIGETGSGKEVVARTIHDFSPRKEAPFVAINCAAIPADMIESELFGHESGAFTGATGRRIGKLEHAQGGTVFLDEIESMPLDLQAKILRAIEQRTIERLGSNKSIQLDVTFIGATKDDLQALSDQQKFRSDLYYRLNVVNFSIPPLRARKEDIPLLFVHLARLARAKYRRNIPDLTPELEAWLIQHDWPGNVRELRNYADRFVIGLWKGPSLDIESVEFKGDLASRLAQFERNVIEQELVRHHGSLKQTYEHLGLSRKGLYDKIKRLGIQTDALLDDDF